MTTSAKEHWNKVYSNRPVTQLGWYEPESYPSNQMIERCAVPRDSALIDIGSGTTTLIPELIALGYQNIYAIDISAVALEKARALLGSKQAAKVRWIEADMADPATSLPIENAAIWHDRAAFHFLTEEPDRQSYHALMHRTVRPGGYVIIATFAVGGAPICSGLPVQRYSAESLGEFMGEEFRLVESSGYTYQQPSGDLRPYVYARFQKMDSTSHISKESFLKTP